MYCTNCGANLKDGTKFCTNCGANQTLDENAENESITPQQEEEIKELKKTVRKRKSLKSKALISCIAVVTVLIIALVGIFSIKLVKVEKIQDSIDLGNKYLNDGNYEEAILVFEKAIKIDKKNINARVSLIKTYLLIGNSDKAESIADESIKIDIKNEEVYIVMADMYCEINMDDEALLILEEGYENTESKEIQNKIRKIESKLPIINIEVAVNQNDKYELPSKVKVKINDSDKELTVNWDNNVVDTSEIGEYTFNGVTEEYDRKVSLTLGITEVEKKELDPELKDYIPSYIKDYQFAYLNIKGDEKNEALILCNEGGFAAQRYESSSKIYIFEKNDGKWTLFNTPSINQKHGDLDSMANNNMIYVGSLKINNYDSPVFLMHGAGYSYNYQAVSVFVYNNGINDFDYYGGVYTRKLDIYIENKFPKDVLAESKQITIDAEDNEIVIDDGIENITHLIWDGKDIVISKVEQKTNEIKTDLVLTKSDGMSDEEYYSDNKSTIKLGIGQTVYFQEVGNIICFDGDGDLYQWIDKVHLKTLQKGTFEIWLKDYSRHFIFEIE